MKAPKKPAAGYTYEKPAGRKNGTGGAPPLSPPAPPAAGPSGIPLGRRGPKRYGQVRMPDGSVIYREL